MLFINSRGVGRAGQGQGRERKDSRRHTAELGNRSTFVWKPIAIYVYIYIYFYIKFMRYQIMLAYR